MDEILKSKIAELRDLWARGNRGEWQALQGYGSMEWRIFRDSDLIAVFPSQHPYHVVTGNTAANAKLVAAAVNALPYLLDELDRLQGLMEAQRG